jgi:beta-galactosidase
MRPQSGNVYRAAGALLFAASLLASSGSAVAQSAAPGVSQPTILYGAAYYNEYMPADLQPGRLDKDVAMMQAAGITVVRMGESTWSLWEPADGQFEYAWMDRVVDAMGKAGIKVIMGTPTYSIPTWMAHAHPEILARPLGGGYAGYGMRQNMDFDNPQFRFYAQRLITNLVSHYKDNPTVIGWQIDNETSSYGASNPDVFAGFVDHLKKKFGTTDALNKAWFLNYWGQDVNDWADMPTRDDATSTSYKLEWTRWQQIRVTRYLAWQAELVRSNRSPNQFVTQDYGGMIRSDVNEPDVAAALDVVANNIYHGTQEHMDGAWQALQGDFARSLKHTNFLVTETNAQTLGWNSAGQFPPYDGQMRLDVYTDVSSGANMVEYWHWHSIHAGQETYWKGVLSHDLEPNRAYAEVSRVAHELKKIGPELADMKIHDQVAILYSVDSMNGISFMPFETPGAAGWVPGRAGGSYGAVLNQLHRSLYNANVGCDFVFPTVSAAELAQYKLLIVPVLYISDDALLRKISDYVHAGGHVLMTFKSGFANENSAVRWELAPGRLREAAGFTYQEFSNLEQPLALKGDPYHAGGENQVSAWAEFLQPTTATPLAYYDHPFFGKWPAITSNHYGSGTLTYEGTLLSDTLQSAVVLDALREAGLTGPDQQLPAHVRVKHGIARGGQKLHYYLNYSSAPATITYPYAAGTDLLTGRAIATGAQAQIGPWDLVIVKETATIHCGSIMLSWTRQSLHERRCAWHCAAPPTRSMTHPWSSPIRSRFPSSGAGTRKSCRGPAFAWRSLTPSRCAPSWSLAVSMPRRIWRAQSLPASRSTSCWGPAWTPSPTAIPIRLSASSRWTIPPRNRGSGNSCGKTASRFLPACAMLLSTSSGNRSPPNSSAPASTSTRQPSSRGSVWSLTLRWRPFAPPYAFWASAPQAAASCSITASRAKPCPSLKGSHGTRWPLGCSSQASPFSSSLRRNKSLWSSPASPALRTSALTRSTPSTMPTAQMASRCAARPGARSAHGGKAGSQLSAHS